MGHVNEQWQSYWEKKFADRGFEAHDDLRWKVWEDPRIEFWYAQNTVVYARPGLVASAPSHPFDVAHPGYEEHRRMLPMKWKLLEAMPEGLRRHARLGQTQATRLSTPCRRRGGPVPRAAR